MLCDKYSHPILQQLKLICKQVKLLAYDYIVSNRRAKTWCQMCLISKLMLLIIILLSRAPLLICLETELRLMLLAGYLSGQQRELCNRLWVKIVFPFVFTNLLSVVGFILDQDHYLLILKSILRNHSNTRAMSLFK